MVTAACRGASMFGAPDSTRTCYPRLRRQNCKLLSFLINVLLAARSASLLSHAGCSSFMWHKSGTVPFLLQLGTPAIVIVPRNDRSGLVSLWPVGLLVVLSLCVCRRTMRTMLAASKGSVLVQTGRASIRGYSFIGQPSSHPSSHDCAAQSRSALPAPSLRAGSHHPERTWLNAESLSRIRRCYGGRSAMCPNSKNDGCDSRVQSVARGA
jgi:hypothetical protein